MKKIIKNALATMMIMSILLSAFAGCGKNTETASAEPGTTTEAVTETIAETTAKEELSTEITTEEETEDAEFLTAEKGDRMSFASFMEYILGYGRLCVSKNPPSGDEGYSEKDFFEYNYKDFDCTTKDAFNYAFACMLGAPYAGMEYGMKDAYDIEYESYFTEYELSDEDKKAEPDPQKKFEKAAEYAKFDGKTFDSMLENIFNVKPDHNYVMDCDWDDIPVYAYYHNGNYYILRNKGGDGAGPRVIINTLKTRDDGKYDANITYQWGNDYEGYSDVDNLNVVAGLKEWNGHRVWSLYSIKMA